MRNRFCLLLLFIFVNGRDGSAQTDLFELGLRDAESEALKTSNRLKSFASDAEAAGEQRDSQFSGELPKLSLEGSYRYVTEVPNLPGPTPIPFGSHSSYSIGPVLNYTLWDTGASRKAYHGFSKLAESRQEDRKNAELQLLFSVRIAYIRVQLASEELRLVNNSLKLARAQDRDVAIRYRAGAAARLDLAISHREVLNYQLQFKQKQAELSAALKDLLAFLGDHKVKDVSHPGPPNVEEVTLVLKLNPLPNLLADQGEGEIPPPDDHQPQVLSQEFLAQSSELSAASQKSSLFPTVQLSAKTSLDYPNGPIREKINQNTLGATLTMPLFEGNRTRHQAEEKRKEAQAARFRKEQLRVDLARDFAKAREILSSLREQKELAAQDVSQSEEIARLYYTSYKAGRINLIDVQSANLQFLQAQVNAARIDAQILNQLVTLKALSGKEVRHD